MAKAEQKAQCDKIRAKYDNSNIFASRISSLKVGGDGQERTTEMILER